MKRAIQPLCLLAVLLPTTLFAQLNPGGIFANFGVDADTRANWVKYGPVTGNILSDDWFAPSGTGNNVIDTTNAAIYMAALQAGTNISFNKRMSQLLYAKVGGTLWLDGVYGRDFSAASSLKDSTTFTIAAKNGDNPSNWQGGTSSFPNKNDLVDVFAHMRRAGTTVHDSLWFFTAVSTYGTMGSSYFDVELYKNNFAYNSATGVFTTAGPDAGHTQWIFDASGNIIQTGDIIFAVDFTPGLVPTIDVRIWVSQTTVTTVIPRYFNFTGSFNGSTPAFGYASIVSKTGTTAWGAGISNYSSTAANDTTYATPWGTGTSVGASRWTQDYASLQFVEVGLNMTRIGLDPALYSTLSPCQSLFSDIFFKSRSSNSFTSNMQDFVAPLTFLRNPVMDYSLAADTIRCNHPAATITLTNNSTVGYYTWQTLSGGNISGSNSDSSQLNISKPGTYIVSASPAVGCPPTRTDTVVIPIDTFPPVASVNAGLSGNQLDLYGGNTVASNYMTPFGGSQGLTFNWSGPSSFSSTLQNPVTDTAWGTYQLTVTEKRNGCTATASLNVQASMFTVLLTNGLVVTGAYNNGSIALHWEDGNEPAVQSYVVEKMDQSGNFRTLGTVNTGAGAATCLCYTDNHPLPGSNVYRVEAIEPSGDTYYSPAITIAAASGIQNVYLAGNFEQGMRVVANTNANSRGTLVIYNLAGETVQKRDLYLGQGSNTIALPPSPDGQRAIQVVVLFIDDQIVFTQKALF